MARPKNNTVPAVTEDVQLAPDLMENAQKMATLQASYSDERDLVNQLLGQVQMAEAFARFSVTVTTSKLAFIKENKLYQSLKGNKTGDGHQFSGTWEEFCSLLGRSREQIDEDIRNLKTLGEEALESMSRMGIGYRELRQFRKLPEDQKTALIEVAKQGDKEALLEMAEDLMASLAITEKKLADTCERLEASGKRVEVLKQQKDQLDEQLHEQRFKPINPDAEAEQNRIEAQSIVSDVKNRIQGSLTLAFIALDSDMTRRGMSHRAFMTGLVQELQAQLDKIRHRLSLDRDQPGDAPPAWLNEPEV